MDVTSLESPMRTLLPLCALLVCACEGAGRTTITVENGGLWMVWLATAEGHLPERWYGEVGGGRLRLETSAEVVCLPECANPARTPCSTAGVARHLPLALLPGESLTSELTDELWYRRETPNGACTARFTGTPLFGICTSFDAVDVEGRHVESPESDYRNQVENPTCRMYDVTLGAEETIVITR